MTDGTSLSWNDIGSFSALRASISDDLEVGDGIFYTNVGSQSYQFGGTGTASFLGPITLIDDTTDAFLIASSGYAGGDDYALFTVDTSNERVGIGTTSPDYRFHVYAEGGEAEANMMLESGYNNATDDVVFYFRRTYAGSNIGDWNDIGYLTFQSVNDNATPENINYAYIGGSTVDVSDGTEDAQLTFNVMKDGTGTSVFGIRGSEVYIDATNTNFGIGDTSPDFGIESTASNSSNGWFAITSDEAGANNGDIFVIDENEYVGIGINSPTSLLHVFGASTSLNFLTIGTASISNDLYVDGTIYGDGSGISGVSSDPAGNDGQIQYKDGTVMGGAAQFYYDDTNDYIGIWTSTPSTELSILGTASISEDLWASGAFQFGGGETEATVSYSRLGQNTTSYTLSNADDLLISGDLEVDGTAYFTSSSVGIGTLGAPSYSLSIDGTASVSGNFWVENAVLGVSDDGNDLLFGYQAGNVLAVDGENNTFLGYQTGLNTTTGDDNVFIGHLAGNENIDGYSNTAIGSGAGFAGASGTDNTFVGYQAGYDNTVVRNTFIGAYAGWDTTNGNENTFLGAAAGYSNTNGEDNVLVGYRAGYLSATQSFNTFVGFEAGYQASSSYNTFVGYQAGYSGSNAQGTGYETFLGHQAGFSSTTGYENTFLGSFAGYDNATGQANTFVGRSAGANSTGDANTFVGRAAGYTTIGGSYNTFMGTDAGYFNQTGEMNLILGYNAGYTGTDIDYNTLVGYRAGEDVTGDSNVMLGYMVGEGQTSIDNMLYIDNSNTATPLLHGSFASDSLTIYDYLGVRDASPSYAFTVDGTASISDDFFVTGDDVLFQPFADSAEAFSYFWLVFGR
jgi:hypothetical protein